jgi:hydroxymethylglutaryl-CoA reductase
VKELAIGFSHSLITAKDVVIGKIVFVDVHLRQVDFEAHGTNVLDVIGEAAAHGIRRAGFDVRLDSNSVERNLILTVCEFRMRDMSAKSCRTGPCAPPILSRDWFVPQLQLRDDGFFESRM